MRAVLALDYDPIGSHFKQLAINGERALCQVNPDDRAEEIFKNHARLGSLNEERPALMMYRAASDIDRLLRAAIFRMASLSFFEIKRPSISLFIIIK